jgi:hypothetical protein
MRVMATFYCANYPGLVVHDGGHRPLLFHHHVYETDSPKQIELLGRVAGVVKIDPDEHPELMERHRVLRAEALRRERPSF